MDKHIICIIFNFVVVAYSQMQGDQSAAFSPEEQYLDMFPLTKANFSSSVMESNDAWIVIFHDGSLKRSWKSMAVNLRGIVWVGVIDTRSEEKLLEKMEYKVNFDMEARVYPHGPASVKKRQWKSAKNPNEALMMATDSIPDKSLKLKGKGLQDFLMDCYLSTPSRFPLILLTEEQLTPRPYKALSNRFGRYFNFARFVKPSIEDYKALGMEDHFMDSPLMFVLITDTSHDDPNRKAETTNLGFNAIHFDTKKMGAMTYPNVLRFLFAINNNYRHLLPGDNKSNEKEIAEMLDVVKIEERRFDLKTNEKPKPKKKKPVNNSNSDIKLEAPKSPSAKENIAKDEL